MLGSGDKVFVPRSTPHRFLSLGPEADRQFTISSQAGVFDGFVAAVAGSMGDSGSPTQPGVAADFRAMFARCGVAFLSASA